MSSFSSRFPPCTVVLLTSLCRSGVACMGPSEEERGQRPAGQIILVDEPHNVSSVPHSRVCGKVFFVRTISRCLLSSTNYPCTLLQVKAPTGKPHTPHVVQDVQNKKDGFLKCKKVFCAFSAFCSFPSSLPPELPLVGCHPRLTPASPARPAVPVLRYFAKTSSYVEESSRMCTSSNRFWWFLLSFLHAAQDALEIVAFSFSAGPFVGRSFKRYQHFFRLEVSFRAFSCVWWLF